MPILVSVSDSVATISIDRPDKLNALDIPHLRNLRASIESCDADPEVRVLVLTSTGLRSFSAGADISGVTVNAGVAEAFGYDLDRSAESGLYIRMLDLSGIRRRKPMIAAVKGFCLGGGLELALQCDMMVAAQNAQFGLPEVATGSMPGVGGVCQLLRVVPRNVATQMVFSAERLPAERAFQIGLISALYDTETFDTDVASLAQKVAAMGPLAVQMIKMLIDQSDGLSRAQANQMSELAWGLLRDTEDRVEGRAAFLEKRSPAFKAR